MNKYEITFIVRTDIEEGEVSKTVETIKNVLTDKKAKIIEEKDLGQKELAYEIQKLKTGHYFFYLVESDSSAIDEFNRVSKINENIIRDLVVRVEE